MRTEGILGRLFSGDAVLTAVETDGQRIARQLDERYKTGSPKTPEGLVEVDATFSYRRHIDHLTGDLRTAHAELKSAEDEVQRKLMQIDERIHHRDALGDDLSGRFFKVRHTLEALYSKTQRSGRRWRPGFLLANIAGTTPRTPRRFLEQVVQTEMFLRKPAVAPPSLELEGVKIDFVTLADDLKPLRKEYDLAISAVDRARKEAQAAQIAKDKAIEAFDEMFGWISRALESLFHLAGEHELAERIRPSARRRGRRAVDEENAPTEGESTPDSPAEAASPETSPVESKASTAELNSTIEESASASSSNS